MQTEVRRRHVHPRTRLSVLVISHTMHTVRLALPIDLPSSRRKKINFTDSENGSYLASVFQMSLLPHHPDRDDPVRARRQSIALPLVPCTASPRRITSYLSAHPRICPRCRLPTQQSPTQYQQTALASPRRRRMARLLHPRLRPHPPPRLPTAPSKQSNAMDDLRAALSKRLDIVHTISLQHQGRRKPDPGRDRRAQTPRRRRLVLDTY